MSYGMSRSVSLVAPPFYIYRDRAFEFDHLLECVPHWLHDDQSAEVAMLRLLRTHASRVHDPEAAQLFILPVLPYVSHVAGECFGETHEQRMLRAAIALYRSPHLSRHQGRDHLLVTNTFRVRTFAPWFKNLLKNATVGWFEQPAAHSGVGTLHKLAFWRCTVVVPYLANPYCAVQREASAPEVDSRLLMAPSKREAGLGAAGETGRPTDSIFFQGSYSAAHHLRTRFAELQHLPGAHISDVPRSTPVACLAAPTRPSTAAAAPAAAVAPTAEVANASRRGRRGGQAGGAATLVSGEASPAAASEAARGVEGGAAGSSSITAACAEAIYLRGRYGTAHGMSSHQFCLVPRGDTPSSGRLFRCLALPLCTRRPSPSCPRGCPSASPSATLRACCCADPCVL